MDELAKFKLFLPLLIYVFVFCFSCEDTKNPVKEDPSDANDKPNIVFSDSFDSVGAWNLESDNGNYDWTQGNSASAVIKNGLLQLNAVSTCGTPWAKAFYVISKDVSYDSLTWEITIKEAGTLALATISFDFWVNKKHLTIWGFGCSEKPTTIKISYKNNEWTTTNIDSMFCSPTTFQATEDSVVAKMSFEVDGSSADCYGAAVLIIDDIKVYN